MSVDDEAIRATNDDAALCKRSAVQLGYWKDPYIQHFIRSADRKAPEINRGYYARVHAIKYLIDQAIQLTDGGCQIINLGAGYDTLFWRLQDEGKRIRNFIEIDFPAITSKKCYLIKRIKPLLEGVATEDGEVKLNSCDLHGAIYHIVGADLRDMNEVQQKLKESEVDFQLPTIFIAECVLVYMNVNHSNNLLQWLGENFKTSLFINYEQVNMDDRFGQVMIDNLKKRGCTLFGVAACKTLESQKQRFADCGWQNADAWDMMEVYVRIPQADVHRMEKLEFLDERELIEQLLQHYCVTVAVNDNQNIGLSEVRF